MPNKDEFYVGYEPQAPAGIGRHTRRTVIVLLLAVVAISAVLVASQRPFANSRFEYGVTRSFSGVIVTRPYPTLLVPRPGSDAFSSYLLTTFGKAGAADAVASWDGRAVEFDGSLIHRGDRVMVEIADGGVRPWQGGEASAVETRVAAETLDLGEITVAGEIVDSKCFLGVMKPGQWKPHRACAVRCIAGGVPPVLLERRQRQVVHFLLVDEDGSPVNQRVLDVVAEPVEITGRLTLQNDQYVLHADPRSYRRLPATIVRSAVGEGAR